MRWAGLLLVLLVAAGCPGVTSRDAGGASAMAGGAPTAPGADDASGPVAAALDAAVSGTPGPDASSGLAGPLGDAGPADCLAGRFLRGLGRTTLLVGGAFPDALADAGWDVRTQYVAGPLPDGAGPCASCAAGCTSEGSDCSNAGAGCGWWGCWQWDVPPPGDFVRGFVETTATRGQVPLLTYYVLLQASGLEEGPAELAALDDAAFLARYFADWRFFLQQVGSRRALLHLEPDLWGYLQQRAANPHLVPARVRLANPVDCPTHENSAAGFARCLLTMARRYAPGAQVGLHASSWAAGDDVFRSRDPALDVAGHADAVAAFLAELGAGEGDFVAVDPADRDSGYSEVVRGEDRWWDATNQSFPDFARAFAWVARLSERLQVPAVYWQLPLGHAGLDDTPGRYRDNRVDYFFDHPAEVARSRASGFFFSPGAVGQTSVTTDDGHLVGRLRAYRDSGGQPPCPP